jgi:hypothetical protein
MVGVVLERPRLGVSGSVRREGQMRFGELSAKLMQQDIDCRDYMSGDDLDSCEIVFDTSDRQDLILLSIYLGDDGKIHFDVGDKDE